MKCLHGPRSTPATQCQAAQLRLHATRRLHLSRAAGHRLNAALVGEAAPQVQTLGFEPEQQFRATYEVGELLGEGLVAKTCLCC